MCAIIGPAYDPDQDKPLAITEIRGYLCSTRRGIVLEAIFHPIHIGEIHGTQRQQD
jgi:hypothetical protein